MKKFGICLVLVMFLFMSGCKSSESKIVTSLDNFESVLKNEGFEVYNKTDSFKSIGYINGSMRATLDAVVIEMFEYTDSDTAKKILSEHVESFNLLKSTGAHEIKEEGQNYQRYGLVSNGYFMISVQVDNTVIFCKTFLDNKEMIDNIYNKLGY